MMFAAKCKWQQKAYFLHLSAIWMLVTQVSIIVVWFFHQE